MVLLNTTAASLAQQVIAADPGPRWWKGNLHTHTFWSDGDDFPEMVAEWYRDRGYHFLALSDHNILSQGQRWAKVAYVEQRGGKVALEKYLARFGPDWVEFRTGDDGAREVRLKPLSEFRSLVEERGRFIMIQSEEISDAFEGAPIHINATNLLELIEPQKGTSIVNTIENNFRAIQEQSNRTGQQILPHLNHPNFQWAITAEQIAEAVSDQFFEVFNGHPMVNQLGDEQHLPVERMWDIANTLRMKRFNAPPLYGLATDDSHHHHQGGMDRSSPGRGWVMVRCRHLTPESLIRALKAGDFYASTGVTLREVRFDSTTGELSIQIEPDGEATFTTQFVGTPKDADIAASPGPATQRTTQVYSNQIGKTFATVQGLRAVYRLNGQELYVRAIITSSRPHPVPVWQGQLQQAWTQPVVWQSPPGQ
ncbi:hypothetical protein [Fontivita pretiosa]|uniref:hypothetical protein n=1 Tax=Fontivita pretiosa TaxID=2989684 RepID=UPI003D1683D6